MVKLKKPRPLESGDTIAVIRPAGRIDQKHYLSTLKWIRELGFCVAEFGGPHRKDSYFAASDETRAREIQWAFSEPGIRLVIAARGGYGSQRALDHLSARDLKTWSPRIFVGYSDITYMHQWIQNQLGWTTIHGPLAGFLNKPALKKLFDGLIGLRQYPDSEIWTEATLIGKRKSADGILVGGNLSLLQTAGQAALPREKIILAIEDIAENYYRLDRMIWNLIQAGYDKSVQGILLGSLHMCGRDDARSFGQKKFIESLQRLCAGPILMNCRFGHGFREKNKLQRLLPLGVKMSISGNKVLYHEPVVTTSL